jgi:hypothetical protein
VVSGRGLLGFDLTVNRDAASDAVAVALCHHVGDHRRNRCFDRMSPGQAGKASLFWLRIAVEVADAPLRVGWAKNFVGDSLQMGGHEGFGTAAGRGEDGVGAEDAAEPVDADTTEGDCHDDDERNPGSLEEVGNRGTPMFVARSTAERRHTHPHIWHAWGIAANSNRLSPFHAGGPRLPCRSVSGHCHRLN